MFAQFDRTTFLEWSHWLVHFDCTTFLEKSDWSVQIDCTDFFSKLTGPLKLISKHLEWSQCLVHLDWFLHNLDQLSAFGLFFEFEPILSIWPNFQIQIEFWRLEIFSNSARFSILNQSNFQELVQYPSNLTKTDQIELFEWLLESFLLF